MVSSNALSQRSVNAAPEPQRFLMVYAGDEDRVPAGVCAGGGGDSTDAYIDDSRRASNQVRRKKRCGPHQSERLKKGSEKTSEPFFNLGDGHWPTSVHCQLCTIIFDYNFLYLVALPLPILSIFL